jgi:hypothetical protein
LVKDPHVSEIRYVEASAELSAEGIGQDRQEPSAVFSTGRSSLFEFDDVPADLPAGLDLHDIDGSQCPLPGVLNQIAKTVKKPGGAFVCFEPLDQILRHRTIRSYRTCWSSRAAVKIRSAVDGLS